MKLAVIGAGALGGSIGARLAQAGAEVTLVDVWREHVEAIRAEGLRADGVPSPLRAKLPACLPDDAPTGFDVALVATDANSTGAAASAAARVLAPEGFALTVQNGIGNLEVLQDALGRGRVVAGSTMCSFRTVGAGHVEQTHIGTTTIGELDGRRSERVAGLAELFGKAGYPLEVSDRIEGVVWTKFALNCAINALCAATGLRTGEMARVPAMDRFQDRVMDEIFAVVRAKGLELGEASLREKIKAQCWLKYNKPSMLQHVEAGRRTEIDSLNGALLREADALGMAVPYNDSLVALLKGRERARIRDVRESEPDYANLERKAKDEPRPARAR